MIRFIALGALALLMPACSCAKDKRSSKAVYTSVVIEGVPHVTQKPDFCGEACAEMVLKKLGKTMDQDYVFNRSGLDPAEGRGCATSELATALKRIGFHTGSVWQSLPSRDKTAKPFAELHADLVAGVPSIVCMYSSEGEDATEHFRLVVGYDAVKDEVIYHEPSDEDGAYRRMARKAFLGLWPLKSGSGWTVIRLRMEAGEIEEKKTFEGHTAAEYAQHMIHLKDSVPVGFTVFLEKPFVVIGDESPDKVRQRAVLTVKWAVDMLKQDFFDEDPKDIIDIWLFKDEESYTGHAKSLFGDEPDTPYGYYSDEDKALVMNIATGGGTLVHEIVHPFMDADFPGCPAWLNEGMGSLYEQCMESVGHIAGLTNWRLPGLQDAIKDGNVPSFEELLSMTDAVFYKDANGTNYAQSRYLCYYLQEKGMLVKFYKTFRDGAASDPTGLKTLKKILGEDDMAAFKKKWEAWVLTLTFDG